MADNVADRTIGELDNIGTLPSGLPNIQPNDLFVAQQASSGDAVNVTGAQLTAFINRAVVGVDVDYIAATETGSADYNSETGLLTLHIPIGDGIASIQKTATSGATDTYTITLDTGSTFAFQVTNGSNIQSVTWDSYRNYNGRRIDKYKITLTDGQTFYFEVTNGKDGEGQVNSIMGQDPIDGDFTTYQMLHTLLPIMMPVGYVYMSTANQSPAIRYAQYVSASEWTWEKIEGRYLVAAGKADSSDADCPTYYAGASGSYETTIDFSNGGGAAKIGYGNDPYNYTAIDATGGSFTDISHVGQMNANWTNAIPSGLLTNGAGMAKLTGTQDIEADQLRYGFYVWIRTA